MPEPVDNLLSDYAKRFNEIKTPRKLLWKKNLGTVKVRCFKIYKMQFYAHTLIFGFPPVFKRRKICSVFFFLCPESIK